MITGGRGDGKGWALHQLVRGHRAIGLTVLFWLVTQRQLSQHCMCHAFHLPDTALTFIGVGTTPAGGPLQRSTTYRPPTGVLPEEVPDDQWPREAVMLLYKVDALARYLMPEENQSRASKTLLERMLADLQAPKKRFGEA